MRTLFPIPALLLIVCVPSYTQEPTIRANVRLVEINVIAQDRKGEPITDLTRNDFVVKENGKIRPISFFLSDNHQSPPTAPQALPPNTFTNKPAEDASAVTVFLLDGLNTPFEEQATARRELIRYLRELAPADIFSLGSSLRLVHDFTTDTARLIAALNHHKDRANTEVADSEPVASGSGATQTDPYQAEIDAFLDVANKQVAADTEAMRATGTANALRTIAAHITAVRGRKNLVWISAGFPVLTGPMAPQRLGATVSRNYADELAAAARALNNADISVYPVDAGGLHAADAIGPMNIAAARGINRTQQAEPVDLKLASMGTLADDTGGRVFNNINDLANAVHTATADARVSYTLAFSPPSNAMDGKFHELKVEVKRPGARLRYRKGYVALADVKPMTLTDALANPLAQAGVGLTVEFHPAPNGETEMALNIDTDRITLMRQDGKWLGRLELIISHQAAGQQERPATGSAVTIDLNLTQEDYDKARRVGLITTTKVSFEPGATIHIGVRDVPSGEVGTIHMHRNI